jgi:cyclopropane fatty-acyl-phospholipid synthase-like methyltransferase
MTDPTSDPDVRVRAVADAYDRAAGRWEATRGEATPALRRLLDEFLAELPPGAAVLDVGCGSGVPVARALADAGCRVTGLDVSARLLDVARRAVPSAAFVHGDMRVAEPGGPFDGLVAWDSVFHVPRADHAALFRRFRGWLRDGGLLLLALGGSAWEGTSDMLGETFFYSGHDLEVALRLLRDAGFVVRRAEVDDPGSRGHVAVLAIAAGI